MRLGRAFSMIGLAALGLPAADAVAQGTGLYLRGDIGYAWARDGAFENGDCAGAAASWLCWSGLPAELDGSLSFGGGVGYRLSPRFRADATLTRRAGFELAGTQAGAGGGAPAAIQGEVRTWTTMLTGYVDLGGFLPIPVPFAPYVGAGLGFSRNSTATVNIAAPAAGLAAVLPANGHAAFAWQLTAGTGFSLAPFVMLDLGYRYLDLGNVEAGSDSVGHASLRAHEIAMGVRINF